MQFWQSVGTEESKRSQLFLSTERKKHIFAVAEIVLRIRIQDYPLCEADHQKSLKLARAKPAGSNVCLDFNRTCALACYCVTMSSLKLIVANTDWIQIKRF